MRCKEKTTKLRRKKRAIESAKAFIERMKTDEGFSKEVGEIATAEDRMAFVTAAGFDFTKEELKNVQEKMQLTEDELESLVGGCFDNACDRCLQDWEYSTK